MIMFQKPTDYSESIILMDMMNKTCTLILFYKYLSINE